MFLAFLTLIVVLIIWFGSVHWIITVIAVVATLIKFTLESKHSRQKSEDGSADNKGALKTAFKFGLIAFLAISLAVNVFSIGTGRQAAPWDNRVDLPFQATSVVQVDRSITFEENRFRIPPDRHSFTFTDGGVAYFAEVIPEPPSGEPRWRSSDGRFWRLTLHTIPTTLPDQSLERGE